MTDKMTIEKAREILGDWKDFNLRYPKMDLLSGGLIERTLFFSEGFVTAWESRQTEVDELKKEIERLKEKPKHRFNGERVWSV